MSKILIVAGSRTITDRNLVFYYLSKIPDIKTIISGLADGPDKLGKEYALAHGIELIEKPAQWNLHGKSAGYIRNAEMADLATHLLAFWDGQSRGTAHMIETAKKKNLRTRVVYHL